MANSENKRPAKPGSRAGAKKWAGERSRRDDGPRKNRSRAADPESADKERVTRGTRGPRKDDRSASKRVPWKSAGKGDSRKAYSRTGGKGRPVRERRDGDDRKPWKDNKSFAKRPPWKKTADGGADRREGASRPARAGDRPFTKKPPWKKSADGDERRKSWPRTGDRKKPGAFRRESDAGPERDSERSFDRRTGKTGTGDSAPKPAFRKTTRPGRREESRERSYRSLNTDVPIRLNRYIAHSGICSRREADDLISAGLVSINGKIITELGTKVNPGDEVKYDNQRLNAERIVYVLLNKPKDFITTVDDPEKRNTVMQLIGNACKERIYPVGRLDRNTTGLLLFTNDGDLTRKLTHPSSNVSKIYHVELDKKLSSEDMKRIAEGLTLDDGFIKVDEVAWADPVDKTQIGIRLHSGKNRVVRRIFETLKYDVRKLDRVVFAGLTKKDLPRGRWRFLTASEVSMLKMLKSSVPQDAEN